MPGMAGGSDRKESAARNLSEPDYSQTKKFVTSRRMPDDWRARQEVALLKNLIVFLVGVSAEPWDFHRLC
jgi:hypothetical protein